MKKIKGLTYIGVDDLDLDLFEGQYVIPEGVSYNSYILEDEKIAVFDAVDKRKIAQWLKNLDDALGDKTPDYLVVSHVEPDHSAGIMAFAAKYPTATVVGNSKIFAMIKRFYGGEFPNKLEVKDGDRLSLGTRELVFAATPMVHWPEVMMTYDTGAGILFSADAFGKFGALATYDGDWTCEARRYYFNIVGKHGVQVQAALKKLSAFDVRVICPLHGPVLDENLGFYLGLYDTWSSYRPEEKGTFIAASSVYGNTMQAAKLLAEELESRGEKVSFADLARSDMAENVEDAFRYNKLVIAAPTLDMGIFPVAHEFILHLKAKNFKNRRVGFIENGTWAPVAAKLMRQELEGQSGMDFIPTVFTVPSSLPDNADEIVAAMADELLAD